ncbi:MAG: glycosyltransferase family 9 protein [Alphaproteobacteria bacterium]|nr:glycosyltransferase family 9 protein [Alphaproteobacteria bacterium]
MQRPDKQAKEKILVIKLSALGDFMQALGAMKAIRQHHEHAHITLMTTKAFESLAEKSGYFDEIILDQRPGLLNLKGWLDLRKRLMGGGFARVYDLQNSDRTALYFKLLPQKKKPEWVGAVRGASHANLLPERTKGHAFDGHVMTLGKAGIENVEVDNLRWIREDVSRFGLKEGAYMLCVAGCSPRHPQKRWSAENYAQVLNYLQEQGIQTVLLGTQADRAVTSEIKKLSPDSLDLTDQTSLFQIITLAQGAKFALGNDTGPMHMIAPTGCPSLVLFSGYSNPVRHKPLGKAVEILKKDNLDDLTVDDIIKKVEAFI